MKAVLVLEDGTVYLGKGFGSVAENSGELVFNTAMTGYQEALTDPSYAGQILTSSYPIIGNYGISEEFSESSKIHVNGFAVRDLSEFCIHRQSVKSLDEFMKEFSIPGIFGIDTRSIVLKIRDGGVMRAIIKACEDSEEINPNDLLSTIRSFNYEETDYVKQVSTRELRYFGKGSKRVMVIDGGAKGGIINELCSRNCQAILAPCDISAKQVREINPDGLFYTNGPGNPALLSYMYSNIPELCKHYPIFGVCLGNQLIGHAFGGTTYKLGFGHRGINQPCVDEFTGKLYITTQNHGYAVDANSLPKELEVWMTNQNDGSVEGLNHKELQVKSVQFHPEARPGTHDTKWIFDEYVKSL